MAPAAHYLHELCPGAALQALNDSADLDVFVRRSAVETPTQEIEDGVDFQRLCSFERINYSPDPNRMLRKTPPPPIERED
jgi:hypothetical protein